MEMSFYLLSMWHLLFIYLFIYFRWFGRDLECQMVALKAYSCFIDFNISIIISIYNISLVIHLVLFDFEHKLSDMR